MSNGSCPAQNDHSFTILMSNRKDASNSWIQKLVSEALVYVSWRTKIKLGPETIQCSVEDHATWKYSELTDPIASQSRSAKTKDCCGLLLDTNSACALGTSRHQIDCFIVIQSDELNMAQPQNQPWSFLFLVGSMLIGNRLDGYFRSRLLKGSIYTNQPKTCRYLQNHHEIKHVSHFMALKSTIPYVRGWTSSYATAILMWPRGNKFFSPFPHWVSNHSCK